MIVADLPLFEWLAADTVVAGLLQDDAFEVAIFRDQAPQEFEGDTYLVFELVFGEPAWTIADRPKLDHARVAFTAYGPDQDTADEIARAAIVALELRGYARYAGTGVDPDNTRLFFNRFEFEFKAHR